MQKARISYLTVRCRHWRSQACPTQQMWSCRKCWSHRELGMRQLQPEKEPNSGMNKPNSGMTNPIQVLIMPTCVQNVWTSLAADYWKNKRLLRDALEKSGFTNRCKIRECRGSCRRKNEMFHSAKRSPAENVIVAFDI